MSRIVYIYYCKALTDEAHNQGLEIPADKSEKFSEFEIDKEQHEYCHHFRVLYDELESNLKSFKL